MSVYRLMPRDGSIPYQKIMTGRRWVGRVVKHAAKPVYLGIIGSTTVEAATATEAFDEVVARHLGYDSADALRTRNRRVRVARRAMRAVGSQILSEISRGDFTTLDRACRTPQGASLAIDCVTRSLFRKS